MKIKFYANGKLKIIQYKLLYKDTSLSARDTHLHSGPEYYHHLKHFYSISHFLIHPFVRGCKFFPVKENLKRAQKWEEVLYKI
jgi:hypothetical protein